MAHVEVEGGCLCGAIRYKVDGEVVGSAACHCRDCQYVCGGAPSYVFVVAAKSLEITKGKTATYRNEAESGAIRIRHFCPTCGTPLFAEDSAFPDYVSIKAGTLDDPSNYKPGAHFWAKSAPPWHHFDPDTPCFTKGANSEPVKNT